MNQWGIWSHSIYIYILDDDKSMRNVMAKLYYPGIHRFVFHLMKDNHDLAH